MAYHARPFQGRSWGRGYTCGVGFWRLISSVRQEPWIWQRMLSRASCFSKGDMRLLCRLSISVRMRAYFFSSVCLSACHQRSCRSQLVLQGWHFGAY